MVYNYVYLPHDGGKAYSSPILHHVLVAGLTQGHQYYYRVGNDKDGWSDEFSFTMPSSNANSIRIAVMGDVGQTYNTSITLANILTHNASFLLNMGDLTYAGTLA